SITVLLTPFLRALGDKPAVGFVSTHTKLAGGALERGAVVKSFGFERGDAGGDAYSRRLVRGHVVSNNCTVYDKHHLAARCLFTTESCGQLAQTPARELFVQLGQLACDASRAFTQDFARVPERSGDAV